MLLIEGLKKFIYYLELQERSRKTIEDYFNHIKLFNCYLEKEYNCPVYVEDLTENDIEDYLRSGNIKGWKRTTRNKVLYILRSFFGFLGKKGYIKHNPVTNIKSIAVNKMERVYLTQEEVKALFNAIEYPVIRVVAQTMYYGGLRITECLELKLNDVDLKKNILTVRKGKGNKVRQVPINQTLHVILSNYLSHNRPNVTSDRLFPSRKTGKLSDSYFRSLFKASIDKLNWKMKVTPHTLRHSFASCLVRKDVNLIKIQRLLGHSNIKTTSIYTHTRVDDLVDAVATLED